MRERDEVSDPGALTGAMIAGGLGIAWALWGASGLAAAVRIGAIVIGGLILLDSAVLQRASRRARRAERDAAPGGASGSMFSSPAYRRVVAVEVIALVSGGALLGSTGHSEYTIAWFAAVVGVHFVVFGLLFWAGFYWLGAAMVAAGIAGAVAGFAGAGSGAIRAVSG